MPANDVNIPALPEAEPQQVDFGISLSDQTLLDMASAPFWVHDEAEGITYEGSSPILRFCYEASRQKISYRLVAQDNSWQLRVVGKHLLHWELKTIKDHASGLTPYSQAEIEDFAAQHPYMMLTGDGKDWLIRKGKNNPPQSYIVCATHHYLLFFQKQADSYFRKVWELYNGTELSGGIVVNGIIRGNEGFGFSDSTPIKIVAATGQILEPDPCLTLIHHPY